MRIESKGVSQRLRTLLIMLVLTTSLAAGGWLEGWDYRLYDLLLSRIVSPASDDIVIVAVDEESLQALGYRPWTGEVHARLVERLTRAGAKAIVLDLPLSQIEQADSRGNVRLIQAIAASNRVFLPVILERRGGGEEVNRPPYALSNVAAGLGHIHVAADDDGITRGIFLHEGADDWPHLMLALQSWLDTGVAPGENVRGGGSRGRSPRRISRRDYRLIPFTASEGHYPRYGYSQVLQEKFPSERFRGKIVIVGVTAPGATGDSSHTPLSGLGASMPGAEVNATILDSLRHNSAIVPMGFFPYLLVTGLVVVIPLILYPWFRIRVLPLVSLAVALAFVVIDWWLLRGARLWLPPSAALFGLGLSYPVWSWLRLDHAVRYLNDQLERMQREQHQQPAQLPRADLSEGLRFLSQLMPLKGWVLFDAEGKQLKQSGDFLGEPLPKLEAGAWQRSGAELWILIPRVETQWRLGLAWPRNQVPQGRSLKLLNDFAAQFAEVHEDVSGSMLERVELRMQQMQAANVRLQRFRHLINNAVGQMDDGLMVINSFGLVLMSNPRAAYFLGHDPDEDLLGKDAGRLLQVLEIRDLYHWKELLQGVLLKGEPIRFEALRPPDTELFVQLKPLDEANAGIYGMIVNLSYVGTLKRSERTRAKMLNFLSHDIRSPITSLLSLTQSRKVQEETASELAAQIEPLARRSLRLADNFLQLARAEAVDTTAFSDTDFVAVAHNAVDEAYVPARERGIGLRREFETEEIWVQGDLGLLERALFNLLENAIKFSPTGSEIRIHVAREGDQAVCNVEDQGPGVPPDQLGAIFLPFTYGEAEKSSQGTGMGLGLSFVKVVADKHRGRVDAANVEGGGARFTFMMPCEIGMES